MSKQEYVEVISTMCVREISRLIDDGCYELAYGEAIRGRSKGAKIPGCMIMELVSMVE